MNYKILVCFPKETLLEIIRYLKERDLWAFSATCKKFNQIANEIWVTKLEYYSYFKNDLGVSPFQKYLYESQNEFVRNAEILIKMSQEFEFQNFTDQIIVFEDLFTYIFYRKELLERNHNRTFRESLRSYLLHQGLQTGFEFSSKKYMKCIFNEEIVLEKEEELGTQELFASA